MKKNAVLERETVTVKAKKPLKELYKGVKLPVFRTLLGSLLYVAGTLIVGTQADSIAQISIGQFTDLSPIFTYGLMCTIGYIFFYISVVADLGFVELAAKIRKKIWHKAMRLPLSYYDKTGPNNVISRVTSDPESSFLPFKLLQLTFTLLAFLLVVLTGNAAITSLALILIFGFILTMVIMFITARFSERGAMYAAGKLANLTAFLAERFGRIKFIKAMNSDQKETNASIRFIEERYEAEKYNAMANTLVLFGQAILPLILYTAAFAGGIVLISNGSLDSTTKLLAFYGYGSNLVLVFQFFAQFPSVFAQTRGGSKKIVSIFEEEEENLDQGSSDLPLQGDISLCNVSFGYDEKQAVANVSCVIPEGKTTALIGPNGSGKTTILRLIDRLYPNYDGTIRIGEEDAGNASLRSWRSRFGIVSQNAALFEGSIRDNICYGLPNVSPEQLQTVLQLSCLEDVIEQHEGGLEFNVGVNGEKLSGGEQQRVAIARAMLRNPDYLILDEATANLDPATEAKIKAGISTLAKGRTVILVAHHYAPVSNADHVIVMNNGTVEDAGTKEELLQRNAFFKKFALAKAE